MIRLLNKPFTHLIFIALLGFLAYSNTFNVPFQWDEPDFIVNNSAIKDLDNFISPAKIQALIAPLKWRYIGYLSFALNYKFHDLDVRGYHIVNLSIHILNAFLVYFLVSLTFRTPFLGNPLLPKGGYLALFSALLFVSHPIQTEAVTYIFQRFASLVTFFYLLSIVFYIKWRVSVSHCDADASAEAISSSRIKTLPLYFLSLLSAVLAMKTKENALTLPIVIMLYEFFFFKGAIKTRMLYLAPFLLTMLIIPLTLIGIDKPVGEMIGGIESATRGYEGISRWDYLLTQFRVIVTYIRLLFLPINQNLVYDYPIYRSFLIPEVYLPFLFLTSILSLGIYTFYLSFKKPSISELRLISFGVFWFFMTQSVESSVVPLPMIIDEYRLYLPSAGVFCTLTGGVFLLFGKLKGMWKSFLVAVLVMIVMLLLYATYERNAVWRSAISLWEDVVRKSPSKPIAHYNLGKAYHEKGLIDKAIEHYQITLSLKSDYAPAHNNLAVALRDRGLTVDAIKHYQTALSLRPDFEEAHFNLGVIYIEQGSINDARKEFESVLQINPGNHHARQFLNFIKQNLNSN